MFNDEILNSIDEIVANHRAFLVGGYLRDYFLKNTVSLDKDIVVLDDSFSFAKELKNIDFTAHNINTLDIKKFTVSLVTKDSGNISRGKYTFFIIFPFSINVNADLFIAAEKNVHGTSPQHKNIA